MPLVDANGKRGNELMGGGVDTVGSWGQEHEKYINIF